MNTFSIRIEFSGKNKVLVSNIHRELKPILEKELNLPFHLVTIPSPPNTMSNDLVVAIQAMAATINALAVIWAIIVTRYRCSVIVEIHFEDGTKMVIEKKSLSDRNLQKEIEKFRKEIDSNIIDKKVKEIIFVPDK